jgi:hypothetical protein
MHTVIYALVPAKNQKEALSKADGVFERLTGDNRPFDYHQMFDTEGTSVSGKGRWGNIPAARKVSSAAGTKMLQEAWGYTQQEFNDNLDHIRNAMKYTNAEIMNECPTGVARGQDNPLMLVRHRLYNCGQYEGSNIWLYDSDGSGIRTQRELDNVINNYGHPLPDGEELWIVPADVHF